MQLCEERKDTIRCYSPYKMSIVAALHVRKVIIEFGRRSERTQEVKELKQSKAIVVFVERTMPCSCR